MRGRVSSQRYQNCGRKGFLFLVTAHDWGHNYGYYVALLLIDLPKSYMLDLKELFKPSSSNSESTSVKWTNRAGVCSLGAWRAPSQSLSKCSLGAKTQTGPGQFSSALTNWRSFQSLIAPGSIVHSWCRTLHTSHASHCAGFPAAPRTCNLISRVSVSKPAGSCLVNWTADVTLKKKSLFRYRVLLSVNLPPGLAAGGLIRLHGGGGGLGGACNADLCAW